MGCYRVLMVFGCFAAIGSITGAVPFIKPCKWDDKECLVSSAQAAVPVVAAGIPALNVPVLDPLVLEEINADQDELKLSFQNLKIENQRKAKIVKLERNKADNTMLLELDAPIRVTGHYVVGGKLLFIPAIGDGRAEIKSDNVRFTITLHMEDKDGHWHIKNFEETFEPLERVEIQLENLFGGDESKSKPVLEILNHSWKAIFSEIGKPIVHEIIKQCVDGVNILFAGVPINELELA